MLDFLFRRLTADPKRGAALFEAVVRIARQAHWYGAGQVPDTLDGRFAVLATVTALVLVRLESEGASGDSVSVALTERFIETLEAEHREFGLGDPALGKTMRKLVGSLARRADLWRSAVQSPEGWDEAASKSLYRAEPASSALSHSATSVRALWAQLGHLKLNEIEKGQLQ